MSKKNALFVILLLFTLSGYSQKINVNHFTGTPTVFFPFYNIQSGACSMPVNLVYATNGVTPTDLSKSAGRDWQVNTGGEIRRVLRGLPDDCKVDLQGNARLGWIYNTKGAVINSFTIANDNNTTICTDETSDINYINNNFSDLADTEPDVFIVDAPGLSCQLVFDNNHVIRTIPYKDLKVTYNTDVSGAITSFNIVNESGINYYFAHTEITKKTTKGIVANILYYKNEYNQYSKGIKYASKWNLSKISDPNGNYIEVKYDVDLVGETYTVSSVDSVNVIKGTASNGSTKQLQFTKTSTYVPKRISEIDYGHHEVSNLGVIFSYTFTDYRPPVIRKIIGFGKEVQFNYLALSFLDSFSWEGRSYQFLYNKTSPEPSLVPDSTSRQMDYWGYYNSTLPASLKPQIYVNPLNTTYERYRVSAPGGVSAAYPYTLSGTNRSVDPASIIGGTLKEIKYSEGGSTTLTYEPNNYYDVTSASVQNGGGVRIKQIVDYDGINTANNIVRNFSYLNPVTGLSSGKPISIPSYAFTTPYTGSGTAQELWNYSTIRSDTDLSEEDNSVIYSHVKESRVGMGGVLYEFLTPATNWDLTAPPDWAPTMVNIARPSCVSYGFVKNDVNTYPYPPNTNFEFERGLIKNITNFNEAGSKVSEIAYTYQRTGSPLVVTGFKWEDNATVKSYSKYKIYTSTGELISQEVNKVFDSSTLTTFQQTTSKTYYTSTKHKLPTQLEITNSDGSIQRAYTIYSKDFNVTGATDINSLAISGLQSLNINVPVEKYYKTERTGTNKFFSAELIKFKAYNPTSAGNLYLPSQKLTFGSASGVTDFVPSTITTGLFANDPRYIITENYQTYDFSGLLQVKDDNNKNVQTVITDHITMQPVASVTNASTDEIAFNDFDSEVSNCGFIKSTYNYSINSRTGSRGLSLEALGTLSRTIKKNANANSYIFSVWINSSVAGNLTLNLTNASSQTSTYTLPFTNNAGIWKYYELKVPVSAMSPSFSASFKSSVATLVDDVLFYPENAEVATVAYDQVSMLKTAETNTNGVSKFYTYDALGRLKNVYDQDKQIVLNRTYENLVFSGFVTYNIISASSGTSNVAFSANFPTGVVQQGMTFEWDFGDGSPLVTGPLDQNHIFSRAGTYTVNLKINSPVYGTKIISATLSVSSTLILHYVKSATGGKFTSVQLANMGNGPSYNFTEADLLTNPTVAQGTYTVTINYQKQGGTFKSIFWEQSDIEPQCAIIISTLNSPFIYNSADLNGTSYLNLTVSAETCLL